MVSVSRVRRRQARHKPSGPEEAVPIARGTSKAGLTDSQLPMAAAVSKGLAGVDLLEESFQRGSRSRSLLAYRDLSMTSRTAFQVVLRSPSPSH